MIRSVSDLGINYLSTVHPQPPAPFEQDHTALLIATAVLVVVIVWIIFRPWNIFRPWR